MNGLLWGIQIVTALIYAASGVMKAFLLAKVRKDVPSFDALPDRVWHTLGVIEMICAVALVLPAALHWHATLTIAAAVVLAVESLVFIGVHVKSREVPPLIMSAVLGLAMAGLAYGRLVVSPFP
jgi:uncharacterized membrane protein YphA (DoxX/SURF4 family)